MSIEDRVRASLSRQATGSRNLEDDWAAIQERIERGRPIRQRPRVLAALVALAVAAGGLVAVVRAFRNTPLPAAAPAAGTIAFVQTGRDGDNLVTVAPTGHGLRVVARSVDSYSGVSWSPDGRRVVFSRAAPSDPGLYMANADGTGARKLHGCQQGACSRTEIAWSPDGAQIALVVARGDSNALEVVRVRGGVPRILYDPGAHSGEESELSWSPDSRTLLFTVTVALGIQGPPPSTIFTVDTRTGNVQKLLTDCPAACHDFNSAWSPDGTKIAFSRIQPVATAYERTIAVVNGDGTGLRTIFRCTCGVAAGPIWSPDGKTIAFSVEDSSAIHLVQSTGGHVNEVPACTGRVCVTPFPLVWSRDGRGFAMAGLTDPLKLYVMSPAGSAVHPIANDFICCLAWLPN